MNPDLIRDPHDRAVADRASGPGPDDAILDELRVLEVTIGKLVDVPIVGNVRAAGVVVAIHEDVVDDGGPESGPRLTVTGIWLDVRLATGETVRVDPDDVQPIDVGAYVAFDPTGRYEDGNETRVGRVTAFVRGTDGDPPGIRDFAIVSDGRVRWSLSKIDHVCGAEVFEFDGRYFESLDPGVLRYADADGLDGDVVQISPGDERSVVAHVEARTATRIVSH